MPDDTAQDPFVVPVARVLLLLAGFSRRRPDGLTTGEVARIDFLLRHPSVLGRLATDAGRPPGAELAATESERLVADSAALLVRYGPWDSRYRLVLGRLIALGLITPSTDLAKFTVTARGHTAAVDLRRRGWERVGGLADLAARVLANHDVEERVRSAVAA
ncbi:MAG: hypothetical protein U0Q12_28570 [Vicinamibacterales bacterium]